LLHAVYLSLQTLKDSKRVVSQLGGHEEAANAVKDTLDGAKKEENDRWQVYKEISEKVRVPFWRIKRRRLLLHTSMHKR
jgi:hypothetical protein